MCEYLDKAEKKAPNKETFEQHMLRLYPKYNLEELSEIRRLKFHWVEEAKKRKLGKQEKNVKLRLGEQEYDGDFHLRSSVGIRSEGGGAKLVLRSCYEKTAAWFNEERASGNFVDRTDLFLEWEHHAKELEASLKEKELSFDAQVPGAEPLCSYIRITDKLSMPGCEYLSKKLI